jgi:hypothetical protein
MHPVSETTLPVEERNVPPRSPPATVKEIAITLQKPTMKAWNGFDISKPIKPVVGQIFGSSLAGAMLATT